jgi:hypothetical protein
MAGRQQIPLWGTSLLVDRKIATDLIFKDVIPQSSDRRVKMSNFETGCTTHAKKKDN